MAANDGSGNWVLIQRGVRDTEKLIGQKQYNLAMIKARQTLEYMVKTLAELYNVEGGDLIDIIDNLYKGRYISKTTCEHYHKIRMIGNKAAHDGDDNAYNASSAYHLLSQEVYTFASDVGSKKIARSSARRSSSGNARRRSGKRKSKRRGGIDPYLLLKLIIPVLIIILIIAIIKLFSGDKKQPEPTTEATVATIETMAVTTTAAPTTEAPRLIYTTNSRLNVRSAPSTDGDLITTLDLGVEVDYIKAYDDDWAVIDYDGGEAYVSSQYLTVSNEGDSSSEGNAGTGSAGTGSGTASTSTNSGSGTSTGTGTGTGTNTTEATSAERSNEALLDNTQQ